MRIKLDYPIKQESVKFPWKERDTVLGFVGRRYGLFNSAIIVSKHPQAICLFT